MSFLKRHWLYASVGLVVLLCVALGTFLVWRANQPVETKTVYVLPEPNPERAEILKRALQSPPRAYTAKASRDEATTEDTAAKSLAFDSGDSSSQENEVEEEDLEFMLAELDEETAEQKSYFPPVPEGYPFTPVWIKRHGYQKGDRPDHEALDRVLIKLWNQGDRDFQGGTIRGSDGKIYPIYPDVLYVQWEETTIDNGDGNPFPITYFGNAIGPVGIEFGAEDYLSGDFKTKYPGLKFVPFEQAGYDPDTFLTEND